MRFVFVPRDPPCDNFDLHLIICVLFCRLPQVEKVVLVDKFVEVLIAEFPGVLFVNLIGRLKSEFFEH